MKPVILSLNVGSSSLKFALFRFSASAEGEMRIAVGVIERIGADERFPNHEAAIAAACATLQRQRLPEPDAVGHRLVHGGPRHARPERVSAALLRSLREMVPFAPLHLPTELEAIEAVAARFPHLPQVVCFDTAFHSRLPECSRRLPLPRALYDRGVRRYGFHGLSYEYVVTKLGAAAIGRAVIAHLGNGASMAAVRSGEPIDTSMGFTPAGGFMMSTRSGDLDPGVLLYLLNAGEDAHGLERTVNHESGLLGVSGTISDIKALLELRATDARAAMAIEMFTYQVRKSIGAFAAALGGIDTLVFTGGIGEHAASVRAECCTGLECLGIGVDPARNAVSAEVISADDGACAVRVVRTDEELMIARHVRRLVFPLEPR
jgi:acetate kinase